VQVVKLLAYISDKDLFAEFYRYFYQLLLCEEFLVFVFVFDTFFVSSFIRPVVKG
jgi:hypothetical protein